MMLMRFKNRIPNYKTTVKALTLLKNYTIIYLKGTKEHGTSNDQHFSKSFCLFKLVNSKEENN